MVYVVVCMEDEYGKLVYVQASRYVFRTKAAANKRVAGICSSREARIISRPKLPDDQYHEDHR